jgi:hypothetical protein
MAASRARIWSECLGAAGVDCVVAMVGNEVLERFTEFDRIVAKVPGEATGRFAHARTDFAYAAATWRRRRRVVRETEVVRLEGRAPRLDPRFVVTDLTGRLQRIHEHVHCARGDAELRIQELFDVAIDRTSRSRFLADPLRVLLATAGMALRVPRANRTGISAAARSCAAVTRHDPHPSGIAPVGEREPGTLAGEAAATMVDEERSCRRSQELRR